VKVRIEIVAGARAGLRLEFDDPQVVRFGRHPTCEVAFDPVADRDASSRHAELRREGTGCTITDLGSANGTRLSGAPVGARTLVPPGAEVEFGAGGPRCRVIYDGAPLGTVPPTMMKPGLIATATGAKVGQRTVAMMIDQALGRVRRGSRRLQLVVIALGVALAGTVAAGVIAWRMRPPPDVALRREMVKVMDEQRAASAQERQALQQKLDELQARLARAKGAGGGSDIARANHDAIYLVTVKTQAGAEEGFCTAFAVSSERLVTNAHCVAAAEDLRRRSGAIFVVQNGHPDVRLPVERMKRIAGFAPTGATISPDVGVLKVPGGLLHSVTLAPAAEYRRLATGDPMFTYGFPGRLADALAPQGQLF
jgi:FHA domain/Trypsin